MIVLLRNLCPKAVACPVDLYQPARSDPPVQVHANPNPGPAPGFDPNRPLRSLRPARSDALHLIRSDPIRTDPHRSTLIHADPRHRADPISVVSGRIVVVTARPPPEIEEVKDERGRGEGLKLVVIRIYLQAEGL